MKQLCVAYKSQKVENLRSPGDVCISGLLSPEYIPEGSLSFPAGQPWQGKTFLSLLREERCDEYFINIWVTSASLTLRKSQETFMKRLVTRNFSVRKCTQLTTHQSLLWVLFEISGLGDFCQAQVGTLWGWGRDFSFYQVCTGTNPCCHSTCPTLGKCRYVSILFDLYSSL